MLLQVPISVHMIYQSTLYFHFQAEKYVIINQTCTKVSIQEDMESPCIPGMHFNAILMLPHLLNTLPWLLSFYHFDFCSDHSYSALRGRLVVYDLLFKNYNRIFIMSPPVRVGRHIVFPVRPSGHPSVRHKSCPLYNSKTAENKNHNSCFGAISL